MNTCKNCNKPIPENFCTNCGQASKLKRIDSHYVKHEIEHLLHFEKGILFTIKELLLRPGQNIREFISENRNRLVKPIIFIILTSLVYTLVTHFFHIEDGYIKYEDTKATATTHIFKWIQDHYGYANIIMGIFIALWTKIFFRKYKYNFFEILILLCFVIGMGMLIFTSFALIEGLTKISLMQVSSVISIFYMTWAIGDFFEEKKSMNYLKAFFAYVLGFATFGLSAMLLGTLINLVIKV
jgi:Protein of unknown function (DUF3667)